MRCTTAPAPTPPVAITLSRLLITTLAAPPFSIPLPPANCQSCCTLPPVTGGVVSTASPSLPSEQPEYAPPQTLW
uniref:Putative secreted protein n=1 Tax=Anopheles darlingi TaxID=43151 RepID=A0A2M4DLE3_ANODA